MRGRGMRRAAAAIGLLALVGLIAWACSDGDHDEVLAVAPAVAAAPTTATGTGAPGPSGAVLSVTAPEPIIQSCAIEITATIVPPDPGNPPASATLTVSHASAGIVFSGPATTLDAITSTATWSLDRPVTESWPAGAILVQATVSRANGEILEAEVASEVVEMNTLVVQIGDTTFKNGDTLALPCTTVPPAPLQPSTPIGGYTFPTGPFVPCGPELTGATILPPNVNAAGQTVLSISSSPATVFAITLENHGDAQVQFTSPLVRGVTTVVTISHPPAGCKLSLLRVWFNHKRSRHIDDAMELRENRKTDYWVDAKTPEWSNSTNCPPKTPAPEEVRMGEERSMVCYTKVVSDEIEIFAAFKGTEDTDFGVSAVEVARKRVELDKVEADPLRAEDTEEQVFADVGGNTVHTDKDGCSGYVSFKLVNIRFKPLGVASEPVTLKWTATCTEGGQKRTLDLGETTFQLFVVLDTPKPPWKTDRPEEVAGDPQHPQNPQNPWTDVLRRSGHIAARRTKTVDATEDFVRWIFVKSGFAYATSSKEQRSLESTLWVRPTRAGADPQGASGITVRLVPDSVRVTAGKFAGGWEVVGFKNPTGKVPGTDLAEVSCRLPSQEGSAEPSVRFSMTRLLDEHLKAPSPRTVICSEVAGSLVMLASLTGAQQGLAAVSPVGYMEGGDRRRAPPHRRSPGRRAHPGEQSSIRG